MKRILAIAGIIAALSLGILQANTAEDDLCSSPPTTSTGCEVRRLDRIDDLRLYLQGKSNYEMRYILAEVPYFCTQRNIESPPDWLKNVLLTALESDDGMLVAEAEKSISYFKIDVSERLAEIYKKSTVAYGKHSNLIRENAAIALKNIKSENSKRLIKELVGGYLQSTEQEFILLLDAAKDCIDNDMLSYLEKRYVQLQVSIANLQQSNNPESKYYLEKELKVFNKIKEIRDYGSAKLKSEEGESNEK